MEKHGEQIGIIGISVAAPEIFQAPLPATSTEKPLSGRIGKDTETGQQQCLAILVMKPQILGQL